jgi:hypothetical protein
MTLQKGDVLDRLSILFLKVSHDPSVIDKFQDEILDLFKEFKNISDEKREEIFVDLLGVNSQIWQLESDIRKGKEGEMTMEEVGRRAIAIRDLNRQRITLKNKVSRYKEIKIDHASQPMKSILVFVDPTKMFNREHGDLAKIQIDNSLSLGWNKEDIMLVTNFDYEYNGVRSLVVGDDCFYGANNYYRSSKIPAINRLFEDGTIKKGELYWFHDFDAFQLNTIEESELEMNTVDAGFTNHGWSNKWNAGSFFFKEGARDIFRWIQNCMNERQIDEQDALTYLTDNNVNGINERYKRLNITYNINIRHIGSNYNNATKPLKVAHFHPHKSRHLDLFKNGKNDLNMPLLPDRLVKIFSQHGIK